ncbi:hypothetical protein RFI_03471 [Reticulomyxa filosa]|uniref:EML-like second beta-propeller domain-containing protein n=1 Tax=Reticulomyxa filosa TaxID=46433 RepID=X6P6B5_RETFI|nr:hypothetical protein RFI_03471 [Reticulomyxa filosa]|eukprot:ETO33629.1 hypothetical protein RFI_03471 [Reticulomyxa filosa]
MKEVMLIENVCSGLIRRVQWSPVTGYLYVLCGEEQTLKVFDTKSLEPGKKATKQAHTLLLTHSTTRQIIHGFTINPKPVECVDELLLFCEGFLYVTKVTSAKNKLEGQRLRAVVTKNKEKVFASGVYLPDGSWVVGGEPHYSNNANTNGDTIYTSSLDETVKALDVSGKIKWQSKKVQVEGSDFKLRPAAMGLDESNNALYIGTKTNQIARFDLQTQKASIVVDGHDGEVWGCRRIELGPSNQVLNFYKKKKKKKKTYKKKNDGKWIAVGTRTSSVAVLSYPKLELKATHLIPRANTKSLLEGVQRLRWSPNGKYLAVAHGDSHCYIIEVAMDDEVRITLKQWKGLAHRAAPSHCQWSADGTLLKCFTRDYEVAYWILDSQKKTAEHCTKIPDPDKVRWESDPLVAGWDVQGLYQKGWDGTDLNDCAVTSDASLVASGDDFGTVRLHNYPAIDPEANYSYNGHAEFVVGVDFLVDDSYLLSVGGADLSIFQWKVVRK